MFVVYRLSLVSCDYTLPPPFLVFPCRLWCFVHLTKPWKGYHGKTTSKHSQEKSVDFINYIHKSKERFSTHSQKKNKVAVFYAREHWTRNFQLTQHSHYLSGTLSLSGEITRVVLIVVIFQIMTKIIQYSVSNALSNHINGVNKEDADKLSWMSIGTFWSTISKRISSPWCGFDPNWPVKWEGKDKSSIFVIEQAGICIYLGMCQISWVSQIPYWKGSVIMPFYVVNLSF